MRKILIVDDNINNLLTIEVLLEKFKDIDIFKAENGQEAIDILKSKKDIDLIFMDIMMPILDGIEATKEIRKFNNKVMIITITALDDDNSKNLMIKYGAEDYIVKPIDSIIFKKRVEQYLELIYLRKHRDYDNKAINLFNKDVFNRELIFRISNLNALAELWEYYATDSNKSVDNINYCMRIVYVFSQWLLKHNIESNVIAEESESNLYITLTNIDKIGESVIKNIILRNYPSLRFIIEREKLSFAFDKIQKHNIDFTEEEERVLRATHDKGLNAKNFIKDTPLNLIDKVERLEETEDKIDLSIIEFEKHPNRDRLNNIVKYLITYNEVIEELVEFQNLSIGINSLIRYLVNMKDSDILNLNSKLFVNLIFSVLEDLSYWRKSIFVEQNAKDIHYLDSSLLNSCLQIENLINQESESDEGNDLELF